MAELHLITREEFEPVQKALTIALDRIAQLEALQDEWVSVKVAEKRTGKDRKTLLKEARKKNPILLTKIEGKRSRKYSANSIRNYNNRKTLSRDPESNLRIAS